MGASIKNLVLLIAGLVLTHSLVCAVAGLERRHALRERALAAARLVDGVYASADNGMDSLESASDQAFRGVAVYTRFATSQEELDLGQAMVYQIRRALECRAMYDSSSSEARAATRPCVSREQYAHAIVAKHLSVVYGD